VKTLPCALGICHKYFTTVEDISVEFVFCCGWLTGPELCRLQYYLKPFHAYDNGNLSWDAALEVELAAKSMHANVFDPEVSM
jgi:hypothetical protein